MAKTVLITGGSRGIGLAMVKHFKSAGWQVAACATSDASAKTIPADFSGVCDVSKRSDVERFVSDAVKKLGPPSVVINNAGKSGSNRLELDAPFEQSDRLWDEILAVNLTGTYQVVRQVLPHLPSDGSGRIINVASVLAFRGVPDATAYCAAKHGVLGFSRALSHALAPRKITVNVICPGWTRTDMANERLGEIGITAEQMAAGVPLGRYVEPREVAALALYLATPEAAAITGQSFTIDGGVLA